jgi:hypothetical protein
LKNLLVFGGISDSQGWLNSVELVGSFVRQSDCTFRKQQSGDHTKFTDVVMIVDLDSGSFYDDMGYLKWTLKDEQYYKLLQRFTASEP